MTDDGLALRVSYDPRYDRERSEREADPVAFFDARGFTLTAYEADGLAWVDLVSRDNRDFRVRRYGSGRDPTRAALAAMRRWTVEQST